MVKPLTAVVLAEPLGLSPLLLQLVGSVMFVGMTFAAILVYVVATLVFCFLVSRSRGWRLWLRLGLARAAGGLVVCWISFGLWRGIGDDFLLPSMLALIALQASMWSWLSRRLVKETPDAVGTTAQRIILTLTVVLVLPLEFAYAYIGMMLGAIVTS